MWSNAKTDCEQLQWTRDYDITIKIFKTFNQDEETDESYNMDNDENNQGSLLFKDKSIYILKSAKKNNHLWIH